MQMGRNAGQQGPGSRQTAFPEGAYAITGTTAERPPTGWMAFFWSRFADAISMFAPPTAGYQLVEKRQRESIGERRHPAGRPGSHDGPYTAPDVEYAFVPHPIDDTIPPSFDVATSVLRRNSAGGRAGHPRADPRPAPNAPGRRTTGPRLEAADADDERCHAATMPSRPETAAPGHRNRRGLDRPARRELTSRRARLRVPARSRVSAGKGRAVSFGAGADARTASVDAALRGRVSSMYTTSPPPTRSTRRSNRSRQVVVRRSCRTARSDRARRRYALRDLYKQVTSAENAR